MQLGIAPPMDDLYGKAEFTAEEIGAMRRALDECGVRDMPAFRKVQILLGFLFGSKTLYKWYEYLVKSEFHVYCT